MIKKNGIRAAIRYSEAFKMQIVRELERGLINMDQIRRKYGIGGCYTIRRWVCKYGNGSIGRVIRVEKPEEINERQELKRRVRALEQALRDTGFGGRRPLLRRALEAYGGAALRAPRVKLLIGLHLRAIS